MTRIGYMPWHKSLPIQSKMKTCTITSDGTVKYINASDRTKYEDGTDRDMTLNTMVEIPEFWYKCMKNDTDVFLNLYVNDPKLADVEHVTKFYISAYEATTVDDKLMQLIMVLPLQCLSPELLCNLELEQMVVRNGICILIKHIEYLLFFT